MFHWRDISLWSSGPIKSKKDKETRGELLRCSPPSGEIRCGSVGTGDQNTVLPVKLDPAVKNNELTTSPSNIFQNIWSVLVLEPAVRWEDDESRRRESSVCSYVTLHHIWLIVTETWKFEFTTAGMNSDEWNKDFKTRTESSSVGLCRSLAEESLMSLYSQRDALQRVTSLTALDESICCKNEVRGRITDGTETVTSSLSGHVASLSPQSNIMLLFIFPGFGFCALQNSRV